MLRVRAEITDDLFAVGCSLGGGSERPGILLEIAPNKRIRVSSKRQISSGNC
jgi:hypothetical protein